MIGDIVCGREKSKLVVVEDEVVQSGRPVLFSLVANLLQRVEKVHLLTFEKDPNHFRESIPQDVLKRLVIHDGYSDVLGWKNPANLNVNTDFQQYLQTQHGHLGNHSVAIVIDSLSPLLLHRSAPYTCQTINKLVTGKLGEAEIEQVICLLHRDLHDNHSLSLLEHMATSNIKVMPSDLPQFAFSSSILHKRVSGKVIKLIEHFNMDSSYSLMDVTEVKAGLSAGTPINQPDPTANLTFNLSLTDREKEARSQVKLPYTYDKERQDVTLSRSVGEGKIFYQPDEADDFDEEDPDDDLDI